MASSSSKRIDLGFVNDDFDPRLLESYQFPSKVGGKPSWLSLKPLPSKEQLTCPKCGAQQVFLLQVYAPGNNPTSFHRTIFVFVCRNPNCCSTNDGHNFAVFRSQLGKENDFYSSSPPTHPDQATKTDTGEEASAQGSTSVKSAADYQSLCVVCGCGGSQKCSKCRAVNYCGKDHQIFHWKMGHKRLCGQPLPSETEEASTCGVLFPEFELEMEAEKNPSVKSKKTKSEDQAKAEYEQYVRQMEKERKQTGAGPVLTDKDNEDLALAAHEESEDDQQFKRFKKRVAQNKKQEEQVLRYCKGGEPLWIAHQHTASEEDIPKCSCGAPRIFEFQVMPQLLSYLEVDEMGKNSLDWGTLCVYTCRDSCSQGNSYVSEFLWKQDVPQDP